MSIEIIDLISKDDIAIHLPSRGTMQKMRCLFSITWRAQRWTTLRIVQNFSVFAA